MSVNPSLVALAYNHGFKNPSTGFPTLNSLSLISAMILATVGADALVPESASVLFPFEMIVNNSACAARSGKPRPVRLNVPLKLVGRVAKKEEMAEDW